MVSLGEYQHKSATQVTVQRSHLSTTCYLRLTMNFRYAKINAFKTRTGPDDAEGKCKKSDSSSNKLHVFIPTLSQYMVHF